MSSTTSTTSPVSADVFKDVIENRLGSSVPGGYGHLVTQAAEAVAEKVEALRSQAADVIRAAAEGVADSGQVEATLVEAGLVDPTPEPEAADLDAESEGFSSSDYVTKADFESFVSRVEAAATRNGITL